MRRTRAISDRSIPDKRIPSRTLPIVEVSSAAFLYIEQQFLTIFYELLIIAVFLL